MQREGEMRIRLKKPNEDQYFWTLFQYKYIWEGDEPAFIIGKLINIDEQQQREHKLIEKARLDSATGLLKKSELKETLSKMLEKESAGFFLLIDIDDFKNINDTMGHAAGDVAIKNLADALKKEFRKADAIGRFGGDEFMVFAAGMDDREKMERKFENIFAHLSAGTGEQQLPITVSAGVAGYPKDGKTYEELFQNADAAMYEAKRRGKNQIVFAGWSDEIQGEE
ncbi:MAG: GGDEF domain-containing protein [Bacillota bacterium]|nr:GGDEF domain-containing protein [Bacillota bacterium]